MQDLNDMIFFAEVVDRGGFAAAGRALHLPKSRLSRRIAELEARLGVRLLQRTTRTLSLTAAGETYHRYCVAVREQADAAADALAQVRAEPSGTIRVSCPVTLAQSSLGPLLPGFASAHPRVHIELLVTNRVVDVVQEGIDVALRVRTALDDGGSLVVKRLGTTRALLVAAPDLLARHGRPASTAELAALPTLAMSAADGVARWRLLGPGGATFELAHRPVLTADDLLTLKFPLVQGLGMALMPDYLCREELARGELVEVLAGWHPQPASVLAAFASRRGMLPAVRRFLDFLGERMGDPTPRDGASGIDRPPERVSENARRIE